MQLFCFQKVSILGKIDHCSIRVCSLYLDIHQVLIVLLLKQQILVSSASVHVYALENVAM